MSRAITVDLTGPTDMLRAWQALYHPTLILHEGADATALRPHTRAGGASRIHALGCCLDRPTPSQVLEKHQRGCHINSVCSVTFFQLLSITAAHVQDCTPPPTHTHTHTHTNPPHPPYTRKNGRTENWNTNIISFPAVNKLPRQKTHGRSSLRGVPEYSETSRKLP